MDDDYGFYCDLDNDSPLPRYMTKIKKIDDYYIVVDSYCDAHCDEVDVVKYMSHHRWKSAEKLLKMFVDIFMTCLFIGTSAYIVMHL
jgi:hypothetical protein